MIWLHANSVLPTDLKWGRSAVDEDEDEDERPDEPKSPKWGGAARGALQAVGGALPIVGGLASAAASHWSEQEQKRFNDFVKAWLQMLNDEIKEKERVLAEILARLDLHDEKVSQRLKSPEYQSLLKKTFRNWAGAESEKKREYIRNILSHAAHEGITSDDVVNLFIDWLQTYSEFHFQVIGDIYSNPGTTRGETWERLGKGDPREDSAEADLFKLLIHDLTVGRIIRQHRPKDANGNFIPKPRAKAAKRGSGSAYKSAFDRHEPYELTALGNQFVHYAMTDVPIKIEYDAAASDPPKADDK